MKKLLLLTMILVFNTAVYAGASSSTETAANDKPKVENKKKKKLTHKEIQKLVKEGKLKPRACVQSLYNYNPKTEKGLKILEKYMKDKEVGYRKIAAMRLGHGDERAIPILRNSLNDKDEKVRIKVASSLCKLGDKKIALPIVEKYAEEGHPEVLFYSRLIRYDNKKGEIRENVYYNKKSAEGILMKLLKHKDEIIQSRAAYYLLEIGEKELALSKTEKMLNSSNDRVRNIGKAILRKIGDEKSKKRLKELEYQEIQEEFRKAEERFKRKK